MASGAAHIVGSNGYSKETIKTAKQQRQHYGYGGKSYAQAAKAAGRGHHHGRGYHDWWGWSWPDPKHDSKENAELRRQIAVLQASKDSSVDTINETHAKPVDKRAKLKAHKESKKSLEGSAGDAELLEIMAKKIADLEKSIEDNIPADKQLSHYSHLLGQKRNQLQKKENQLEKAHSAMAAAVLDVSKHSKSIVDIKNEISVLEAAAQKAAGHYAPELSGCENFGISPEMQEMDPELGPMAKALLERTAAIKARLQAKPAETPQQDKGPESDMGQASELPKTQQPAPQEPAPQPREAVPQHAEAQEPEQQASAETVPEQDAHDDETYRKEVRTHFYQQFLQEPAAESVSKRDHEKECWTRAEKHSIDHVQVESVVKKRRQCL